MKYAFLQLFLLLIFISCTEQSGQETNLSISQSFSVTTFPGGFVLHGSRNNSTESIKLLFPPGVLEKKIILTKGQWTFRAVGWNDNSFSNNIQCGTTISTIDDNNRSVNIDLSPTNCTTAGGTFLIKKFFPILCEVALHNGVPVNDSTPFNFCPIEYQSSVQSYKINIRDDQSPNDIISSSCLNLSPTSAVKTPHIPGLKADFELFMDPSCSTTPYTVNFSNGIASASLNYASYRIRPSGTILEGILLPKIEQSNQFLGSQNYALLASESFNGMINLSGVSDFSDPKIYVDRYYSLRDIQVSSQVLSLEIERDSITCQNTNTMNDNFLTFDMTYQHGTHIELQQDLPTSSSRIVTKNVFLPNDSSVKGVYNLAGLGWVGVRPTWNRDLGIYLLFNQAAVKMMSYINPSSSTLLNIQDNSGSALTLTNMSDVGMSSDLNVLAISRFNGSSYDLNIFQKLDTTTYKLRKVINSSNPIKNIYPTLAGSVARLRYLDGIDFVTRDVDLTSLNVTTISSIPQGTGNDVFYYRDVIKNLNYFRVDGNNTIKVFDDNGTLSSTLSYTSKTSDRNFYTIIGHSTISVGADDFDISRPDLSEIKRIYIHNQSLKSPEVHDFNQSLNRYDQFSKKLNRTNSEYCQRNIHYVKSSGSTPIYSFSLSIDPASVN